MATKTNTVTDCMILITRDALSRMKARDRIRQNEIAHDAIMAMIAIVPMARSLNAMQLAIRQKDKLSAELTAAIGKDA